MENREILIDAITQTLAPKLFELCGTPPEEMGFPIYNTKEEVEGHLQQQFSPVEYWSEKAANFATGLVDALEAGGLAVADFDYDAAVSCFAKMRTDFQEPTP